MSRCSNSVLSVFGLRPRRIGSSEIFIREFSEQLGGRGWKSALCFIEEPLPEVREFLTLPNVTFDVVRDNWTGRPTATLQLAQLVRKYRPQILHLHFVRLLTPHPWVAKGLGVKKVYFTDQSSLPEHWDARPRPIWKRAIARAIARPIDHIISVSEFGLRNLAGRGVVEPERFRLIYNSVDLCRAAQGLNQREEFRKRHGIGSDRLVIAQASKLMPEKGLQDLLHAAALVIKSEPRAHVVIAGDGPYERELKDLADALQIRAHVTFTGLVRDPLAEGVYAAAEVACQLSRWQEVFGYTIGEAMASARPVIGTRVGGIPELIADGETGFLVDRGDIATIAGRIVELLRDQNLRERLGRAGREVAATRFNHKANVAQVLELYGI